MSKSSSQTVIERWFADHDNDGEFTQACRFTPYWLIPPPTDDGWLIFTTKPAVLSAGFEDCGDTDRFGMLGRYGLPVASELSWIREFVGPNPLYFLGDLDPVDLSVFSWLRLALAPVPVVYLGISDVFLKAVHLSSTRVTALDCTIAEQEFLALFDTCFPDFRQIIGPACSQIIDGGRKIEIEAIQSSEYRDLPILRGISGMLDSGLKQ